MGNPSDSEEDERVASSTTDKSLWRFPLGKCPKRKYRSSLNLNARFSLCVGGYSCRVAVVWIAMLDGCIMHKITYSIGPFPEVLMIFCSCCPSPLIIHGQTTSSIPTSQFSAPLLFRHPVVRSAGAVPATAFIFSSAYTGKTSVQSVFYLDSSLSYCTL